MTPRELRRAAWLETMRIESEGHPGTMEIHGYQVNMDDPEELRAALLWVSWTSTQLLRMEMQ